MRFCLIIFSLFFALSNFWPNQSRAADFDYDLGIRPEDLNFSASRLIVGQKVRVYATIYNFGAKDTIGYLSFYQGAELLGDSQPISVRARGFADEVFIDFIVPTGSFNIMAAIKGTSPADQNPSNDQALTPLLAPVADADNDGMPDSEDNCPNLSNFNQKDSDGDKIGDACDPDNDNDGLSDVDEIKKGANPFNPDTDGDGLIDSKDKHPLISDKSPLAQTPVVLKPISAPVAAKNQEVKSVKKTEDKTVVKSPREEKISAPPLKIVGTNFEKRDWGNYAFFASAAGGQGNYDWNWDFGDGQSALGQNIVHKFHQTGDYVVKISVKDEAKQSARAEFPVSVSFYSPANPKFWLALGFLVTAATTLFFVSWKPRRKDKFFIE